MACLDLHYYVTVHENLKRRSEERETHSPVVLGDLQDRQNGGQSVSNLSLSNKGLCKTLSFKVINYTQSLSYS